YYKEPGFLMLGTFAFFHLLLGWEKFSFRQKLFDILLLVSSCVFILVYYFIVFINMTGSRYGKTPYNQILVFAKNIFNYMLSDPFLIIVLPLLIMYRSFLVFYKRSSKEPIYDSLLIASFVYVLAFLKLNILFGYYYLLPAYVFGIVGITYFLFNQEYLKKILFKIGVLISLLIFFINSLPTGLHLISYHKNVPINFQKTLDYLEGYIPLQKHRVNIYLDGVNRGSGIEFYDSFAKFLKFRGLSIKTFDFRSDMESDHKIIFSSGDSSSPYTVFQSSATTIPKSGDLLILTPFSYKLFNNEYLAKIKHDYELLYHAESLLPVTNISAKTLMKHILMGSVSNETMMSNNIYGTPLDFYVFRKR
ncbi:MAG: hypothetical protein WCQ90_08050, partial [Deltaproteobacteria bacterium]